MQARASREEIPLLYSSSVHVDVRMGTIMRFFYTVCCAVTALVLFKCVC